MTSQLIFCITIILFLASPVCSVPKKLTGESGAVCTQITKEFIYCNSTIHKEFAKQNPVLLLDRVTDKEFYGNLKYCEEDSLKDRQSNGHHQTINNAAAGFLETLRNPGLHKTMEDSYITVLTNRLICCNGYKNESWTCKPQCSPECENGVCSKPNVCTCHYHWGGYSCNEALACTIAQPLSVNYSDTTSQPQVREIEMNATEKAAMKSLEKLPECRAECLNQVKNTHQLANMTYYVVPIASCNIISIISPRSVYIAGAIIGTITLLVMVICIVYTVRRKQKTGNSDNEPTEPKIYDDVGIGAISEYDDVLIDSNYVYDYVDITEIHLSCPPKHCVGNATGTALSVQKSEPVRHCS